MSEKIGLGILTYKRPEYFKEVIKNVPANLIDEIVVVNDGTPYDISADFYTLIQHKTNQGVGKSKNSALKHLQSKDCDHYFLMEDDIIIKNSEVFGKYIDAAKQTGIQHFNYSQHGLMNKVRNSETPNPRVKIDYKNISIELYTHCVGAFSYYTKKCIDRVGLMDEFYFNATEHLDHTYGIIKANMHPPFWWFADIVSSNSYLSDFPWSIETSTISQNSNRDNIIKSSYEHFTKKHGHHILNTPNLNIDQVKQQLKSIYSAHHQS